jgi:hypothetical protein
LRAPHSDKLGQFEVPGTALQGGDCYALAVDKRKRKNDVAVDRRYMAADFW